MSVASIASLLLVSGCSAQLTKTEACEEVGGKVEQLTAATRQLSDSYSDQEKRAPHAEELRKIAAEIQAMSVSDPETDEVFSQWGLVMKEYAEEMSRPLSEISTDAVQALAAASVVTVTRVAGVCAGLTLDEIKGFESTG